MKINNYQIEDFQTQNQQVLDINLVYATYGELSKNKDNTILVVTSYSATHEDAEDLLSSLFFCVDCLTEGLSAQHKSVHT